MTQFNKCQEVPERAALQAKEAEMLHDELVVKDELVDLRHVSHVEAAMRSNVQEATDSSSEEVGPVTQARAKKETALDNVQAAKRDLEEQKNEIIAQDAKTIESWMNHQFGTTVVENFEAKLGPARVLAKQLRKNVDRLFHSELARYVELQNEITNVLRLLYRLQTDSGHGSGSCTMSGRPFDMTTKGEYKGPISKHGAKDLMQHLMNQPEANTSPEIWLRTSLDNVLAKNVWKLTEGLCVLELAKTIESIIDMEISQGGEQPEEVQISWKFLKTYVSKLTKSLHQVCESLDMTSEEVDTEIERLSADIKEAREALNWDFSGKFGFTRLSDQFIYPRSAEFMELLKDSPLVREIVDFVEANELEISPHVHDSLVDREHRRYYRSKVNPNWEYSSHEDSDRKAENLAYAEECESDERFFFEEKYAVNPHFFYTADLETRVALRLVESLVNERAMQTDEGSSLEADSFAQALARKKWMMERKWRNWPDDVKVAWLRGKFGSHTDATGRHKDTFHLAKEDSYTG